MTAARPFEVRRVRDRPSSRRALIAHLERHEPWATPALGQLLVHGLRRSRCRAWTVHDGSGSIAGAVVSYSPSATRWQTYVALDDPEAAATVAAVVDRCPGAHVSGHRSHVEPVLPQLRRLHSARLATFVVMRYPQEFEDRADDGVRLATREDLDALVPVFESFGIGVERTRWQLRSSLRRMLERWPLFVVEVDGRIVGANTVNAITRRYMYFDQLVVDPSVRGTGLSNRMKHRALAVCNAYGLSMCVVVYATNPMNVSAYEQHPEAWVYAGLYEPSRFRGHARLRELAYRFQPLQDNRNPQFRPYPQLPYGPGYDASGEKAETP
jgi:N-acetylglutamate synthase-like GNAT family acetyltransferase